MKSDYLKMQKKFFTGNSTKIMSVENHKLHNANPDYWNILLGEIKESPDEWSDKKALDFGCGCGRNIENLLNLANWQRVDGCDISETNVEYTKKYLTDLGFDSLRTKGYTIDGENLSEIPDSEYDFVMSTIVFQHICSHTVRFNIMKEIFRILKPGGLFSFQMGVGGWTGNGISSNTSYYEDSFNSGTVTNVNLENPAFLVNDLEKIGFEEIEYEISNSYEDYSFRNWIFAKGVKK